MGKIVTFYSYKGGVGRTMALANVSILLAQRGLRVLAVDWDFESPGLHTYFNPLGISYANSGGLIELLLSVKQRTAYQECNWRDYTSRIDLGKGIELRFLMSGRLEDSHYASKVLEFDWQSFFSVSHGGSFIETLRDEWHTEFDVVLIDSRTGVTDSGGVCTIQLPDVLVLLFTANEQSLKGAREIAQRAQAARQRLAYDRMPLLVFPLPTRIDTRAEFQQAQSWLERFAMELAPFYADWLPRNVTPLDIIQRTKVPHIPYFSFGEKLAVLEHSITDPESLGFAYDVTASLIATDFSVVAD